MACVETNSTATDPFCGFTPLSGTGEAPLTGYSAIGGATVSPHGTEQYFYAFNFADGAQTGTKNKLMCFDLTKGSACPGQPYAIPVPAALTNEDSAGMMAATIGGEVIVSLIDSGFSTWDSCWSNEKMANCSGTWPVKVGDDELGTPFPLLTSSGAATGFCVAISTTPCFNLSGQSVASPAKLHEVIGETGYWAGPAVVLGPRIYMPDNENFVKCFSYATGESCPNFPKHFEGLDLLYTVNPDPQRPTCLWVNSDDGEHQIQSFDAYTGGKCGEGAVRVLAGQFVVNSPKCEPASYESIQVIKPARNEYASGSVGFANGNGESIGLPEEPLDSAGSASLLGLHLNSNTGLPQFLFTFNGLKVSGAVEIKLTWKGTYTAECIKPGQHIARPLVKARLASTPTLCTKASSYEASVSGSPIETVTYKVNGHTVAVVRRANSRGHWNARIHLRAGVREHLTAYVKYQPYVSVASSTLKRTLLRCAAPKKTAPAFTG